MLKYWLQNTHCEITSIFLNRPCSWLLTSVCRAMAASTLTGISLSSIRSCLTNSTAFLNTSSSWKRSGLKQCSTQQDCQNTAQKAQMNTTPRHGSSQAIPQCFWDLWNHHYEWSCPTTCVSVEYNTYEAMKRLRTLSNTDWMDHPTKHEMYFSTKNNTCKLKNCCMCLNFSHIASSSFHCLYVAEVPVYFLQALKKTIKAG